MIVKHTGTGVDRWAQEQMFEEDMRAVLSMVRPHHRERLMGWSEYRTGGAHFRATVSWDDEFAHGSNQHLLNVPRMAEVLETLLVGSVKSETDLPAEEEFAVYKSVVLELLKRLEEAQACYE